MSSPEKKYQVFVSSTYDDLIPERQEIMHALLELDCIPAGMELFPAADEDQWSLIRGVIDDCDYYIVVIGGRYGSLGSGGISYTEMEYRYAIKSGKPVMAFLHKDPESLAVKQSEKTVEGKNKLKAFRLLVEQKMCKYWDSAAQLGSVVSRSLIMLRKNHPGIGWVKGDQIASTEASSEILRLRRQIETLEAKSARSRTEAPKGTEELAQGTDTFGIVCEFSSYKPEPNDKDELDDVESYDGEREWKWPLRVSWNEIFYEISPLMLQEASTAVLASRFEAFVEKRVKIDAPESDQLKGHEIITGIDFDHSFFETAIVQLAALGLIVQSVKSRSVKDRSTYWTLTPYGLSVMNRLRAIRKDDVTEREALERRELIRLEPILKELRLIEGLEPFLVSTGNGKYEAVIGMKRPLTAQEQKEISSWIRRKHGRCTVHEDSIYV